MSVVIERVDQVEIFINEEGTVTIKQESPVGDDASIVVFPVSRIADVVAALQLIEAGEPK